MMKRPAKLASAAIALGLVLALGAPMAATAAPVAAVSAAVPAAEPVPYPTSGSKFRGFMINIVSSVLGKATPNKWKAEQIGNQFKYDHGFETLNRQFGIDGVRYNEAGQVVGVRRNTVGSGTYNDVVISKLEEKYKERSARGTGPVRAPVSPFKAIVKGVGAAAGVYLSYEMAAVMTSAIGDYTVFPALGIDAEGLICGATYDNDFQKMIFTTMAGRDCSSWEHFAEYIGNADAEGWGGENCYGTYCVVITGTVDARRSSSTQELLRSWCGQRTGTLPTTIQETWVGQSQFSTTAYYPGGVGTCGNAFPGKTSIVSQIMAPYNLGTLTFIRKSDGVVLEEFTEDDFTIAEDPERALECTATYEDGTTAKASTPNYRESAGLAPPPVCPPVPDGKTPDSVSVEQVKKGADGAPDTRTPVYEEEVSDEYKDWWEQYPECRMGACKLDLIRLAPAPAVSCFDLEEGCVDWFNDPNKAQNYLCRYGVHDVALSECNVYSGIFQPGRVTTGSPYSDPSTGEWSGGQNAPAERNKSMQRVLQDPTNIRSCEFADVGFDPVGWILRGGQCLAEWTFVARPAVVEAHQAGVEESWQGSTPGKYATALGGLGGAFGSLGAGNCGGIAVSVPVPDANGHPVGKPGTVLDSCPGSELQPISTGVFWILSGLILWLGVLGFKKMLDRFVGF